MELSEILTAAQKMQSVYGAERVEIEAVIPDELGKFYVRVVIQREPAQQSDKS